MCKPHKMGWADRLKARDRARLEADQKEIGEALGCIEHHCGECGNVIINNDPKQRDCPLCGVKMFRLCDEVPEKPEFSYEDEDDENDYGRWGSED